MSTIDEIIASGRYTDRRGRVWKIVHSPLIGIWWGTPHTDDLKLVLHENKMRLLIERDKHRDECEGIGVCESHPVPHVTISDGVIDVWSAGVTNRGDINRLPFSTLSAAVDAARALAVGE